MEVKDFIAEYNKNGTKNLVHTKAEVSKPGALDSKQIASFFVEKVGGVESFAKHYSQWGREYNEIQNQVSGIQDGYSSKDAMKAAAKKLKSLAASGSIYNYINTALGGKSTPNFAESLNKQINALEERSAFYSQWETEEDYNKWYNSYTYNLDDGVKTVTELSGSVDKEGGPKTEAEYSDLKNERDTLYNTIVSGYIRAHYSKEQAAEIAAKDGRIVEFDKKLSLYKSENKTKLSTERQDLANAVLLRLDELSADQLKTYAEAIGWHSTAITTDEGKEVTWKSLYDAKAEGERLDAVYKEKFADSPYTKYYEELLNPKFTPKIASDIVLVDGEYKTLSGLLGLKTIIDHQTKIRYDKLKEVKGNAKGLTLKERIKKQQEEYADLTPDEIIQKGINQNKYLVDQSASDIEKELYTRSNGVPDWHYGINHELSNEELNFLKEFYEYKKEEGEFKTGHPFYETFLDAKKAKWSEWAMDNPVSASFGSLIDTFQGGVQGFLGNTVSMIAGNGIDVNASYNEPTLRAQTMRAAVAQTISNADYESWRKRNPTADYDAYSNLALTWGDVGSFAYMTGMSFADSMIAAGFGALTGGGNVLSLGIMGTSAANSTVLQKKEQGYTDEQAYALGIVSGLAEIVTEKYSLDALFSDGAKGAAYILKNFVTEGTEEGASYLINFVADTLLLTDESEWAKMVQGYRDQGFDESTAFWKSVGDVALQFGADMLGGALCGGFAGAGGAVINYGSAKAMGGNIKSKGLLDAVAELGLKSENKTVLKYAKQLQSGVKLSDATIGNMVTEIFNDVETQTSEDITAALKRRGYNSSSAKEIGESLTKSIVGKSMTLGEARIAMKDAKAVEIAKTEVNTERASMLNGIYRIMTFDVSQLGVEFDDQPTTQTDSNAQPVSAQSESVQPAPVQNGAVAPSSTPNVSGTAPASNESVSGLPASDVANSQPTTHLQSNASGDTMTNERGEYYYDRDTNILAKRGVSAANRGGNGLRQQSKNTEQMERILGVSSQSNETRSPIAAGLCGWIQTNNRQAWQGLFRFLQSNVRNLSAKRINETDTVGRVLSPELRDALANSAFKTEDGTILSLYHWTDTDFDTFAYGDIGFHFGTLEAADKRRQGKSTNGETGYFKEVYLAVENPAFINYDPVTWDVFTASYKLKETGVFTKEDVSELEGLEGFNRSQYDSEASVRFREILEAKGYDGIVYANAWEGDLSVIALRAEQIITVAENGVTKAGLDGSAFSNAQTDADNSISFFDEPDLTDTSGVDTYDRLAQQMMDKPFIYTEQHKRVEQVAKRLGRNLYWDCKFGNGYIDANGDIHLAPDTKSPISKVFKHELTHFLQKNQQMYNRFANAVMDSQIFKDWVKSKGYNSNEAFANHIIETYQAAEQERQRTNPDAPEISIDEGKAYQEMLADFVGEKLFGGKNKITERLLNALEEGPRQSFVDTIRRWVAKVKSALKGTKEGKTIADFEQEFIAAYKAAQKTFDSEGAKNTTQAGGQYDIGVLDNGNTYVIASRRVINGTTLKEQRADITAFFKKLLQNKPSLDIPTIEGDVLTITMAETAHKARDNYKSVAGMPVKMSNDEFRVKLNVEAHIDEIAETSIPDNRPPIKDTKNHSFAKSGFKYRTAYFEDFDGQYYKIRFSVGQNGTVATVYNVGKIEGSVPSSAKLIAVVGSKALNGSLPNNSIPNSLQNVNKNTSANTDNSDTQYSITIDTEYMQAVEKGDEETAQRLVNEAAERAMSNSKARDIYGKLDLVYHGTSAEEEFYVFDKARQGQTDSGMFGKGFYFTADYEYAEMYAEENPDNEPRAFFLNITNPFEITDVGAPASEIANKLIDLGVSIDFDYRGLEAHEFANKFGNKRFSDTLQEFGYDGVIVNDGFEYVVFDQNQMKSADAITYDDNGNVIPLEQRFDYDSNDVRYSIDVNDEVPNIKINMSEDQRYEVLKDEKIQPQNIEVDKEFDISFEYLENNIKSIIEKPLINKLRELGYLRKYRTSVIDVDFEFTGGGLRKSLNSQIMDYGGSFADLAKVVLNLQVLLDNSILLEIHSDKGKGTSRENPQLIQTYVLLGAFREDNVIKPVQFEVKQYVDDSNRLYLAVALTKIETGVMGNTILDENQASTYLLPVSAISIPDLVAQINPRDAKLLKYIPNQFLSERQIDAKNIEIAKDAKKYSDSKKDQYSFSVETATDLLEQYEQGKITKEEYLSRISRQKVSNPAQIAKLTPDDASTTPNLSEITDKGKQDGQSRFYSNVKEKAKFVSDTVKNMVSDDSFIKHYATITNKETLEKAAKKLDEGGAALVQEWATKDERNMTAEDISIGLILIERYQVEGNHSAVINVMRKMRKAGTIAGQAVQSFSLLGRLDPTSMQMYMQKELDEAYETMVEGKTNKWIQANKSKYELTEEELDYIRRRALQAMYATDSRAKDIAIAEILAMVSNKIPPEKGMALKSLVRTTMLFNLKTQVRNVLGNVSMVPAHWASDLVGTAIDGITAKFTGYRTKGINIATRKNGEAFIRGAREAFEDYRLGIDTRQDLDRFDVGPGKAFNDRHEGIASIINPVSRTLNRIDRFNSFLLELGDRPFFEYWFTNSLENQMRLNGVTEPTVEMLEIAEQEALTRVWQDTNRFTKSVTTIKKILNSINVRGYGLGDVFIKFVKTPANLTKAMVDFSPVGLIHGIVDIVKLNRSLETGIGNSKLLQSQMVKSLSNGIVGTLLYIAFYALAAGLVKGVAVSGASDDDDDVAAFNREVLGRYPYTISIGDYSFSYDWMSPIGSMISTAKAVVDATESDKDIPTTIRHAMQASADVLFNQSFMQSLQEVFTNRGGYWAGIEQTIIDEPAVLIPQLVAQFASSLDEYQRETYQKDDAWQTMLNDTLYKLPWLRETLEPRLDALGRDVANPRGDFFNAFLNPANTYVSNNTETAEEVYRLYESTGEASVMYPKAPRSVTIDGETRTLTIKERNQYQKTLGTISDRNIDSLMRLGIYKEMSDTERVKTIADIYEYARAIAKSEYLGDESSLSTKYKKIKVLEDQGVISATEYLMLFETSDADGNNYLTNAELNRGLQTYIEDVRMRQFVKQLYRAKGSEIDSVVEKFNN